MWFTLIFSATAGLFLVWTLFALWHLRWVHRLPALETFTSAARSAAASRSKSVRCSVIIAARDEETRIEQTMRHLLDQREVELEFIVVDDRCTDRTGEILQRLAAEDSRVKIKRVEVLPGGWQPNANPPIM